MGRIEARSASRFQKPRGSAKRNWKRQTKLDAAKAARIQNGGGRGRDRFWLRLKPLTTKGNNMSTQRKTPLYKKLAFAVQARLNCENRDDPEDWFSRWEDRIEQLALNHLPSGSGFDCGTVVDLACSTGEKLVLRTSFHHMDEHGGYDGWTKHKITVLPSLQAGFRLSVTGRNKNSISEHIYEVFVEALDSVVDKNGSAFGSGCGCGESRFPRGPQRKSDAAKAARPAKGAGCG